MNSAMPGRQCLGFGHDDQVFELQKILQFHFLRRKHTATKVRTRSRRSRQPTPKSKNV